MKAMKKLIVLLLMGLVGCSTPAPNPAPKTPVKTPPMPPLPPGIEKPKYDARVVSSVPMASRPKSAKTKSFAPASLAASAAPMVALGPPTPPDPCAIQVWVENHSVHMYWPCLTNVNFRLDCSLDLTNWQTIGTSINTNAVGPVTNIITLIDSTADYRLARFFRFVPVDTNGVRLPSP